MMLGDLKIWKNDELINENDCIELSQPIEFIQKNTKGKVLFISTGIVVQDVLTSQFIYNNFQKKLIKSRSYYFRFFIIIRICVTYISFDFNSLKPSVRFIKIWSKY